ncbi:uncharacterized protein [Palaemon carinicauda]|uniref:uncharacterized protein n=1 Tax=Palaemon carinicauda TaxID=392227 RepID=UPI0035B687F3
MKPRSMKPAFMVLSILVVSLVLNSLLLVSTRSPQDLKEEIMTASEPVQRVQPTVIPQYPAHLALQKFPIAQQEHERSPSVISKYNNSKKKVESAQKTDVTSQPLGANVIVTTNKKPKEKTTEVTESFVPKEWKKMKENERQYESGYRNNPLGQSLKKYLKAKKEQVSDIQELSFGFVNNNFKPPDISQTNLVDLMGLIDNSTKKKTGLNPGAVIGSVIGAVVEAKKLMSDEGSQKSDANNRSDGNSQLTALKVVTAQDGRHPDKDEVLPNQNNVDSKIMNLNASNLSNKDGKDKERDKAVKEELTTKRYSKGPLSDENNLGALVSKYGPSLFSLAFNTNGQTQSDNSNNSPLMSIMGSLGPILLSKSLGISEDNLNSRDSNPMLSMISNLGANMLSNRFSQTSQNGKTVSQGSPNSQKQDLLYSLVSGVGPMLMASVVGGGLSSKSHNDRSPYSSESNKSPLQSILTGLGPALMGGSVQNLLGNSKFGTGEKSASPVQSIISGLAPVLLAGALGGHDNSAKGRSNSKTFVSDGGSPLQSLFNGLGPVVLKAVGQGLGGGFSETVPAKEASTLGGFISNMAPMLMEGISTRTKKKPNATNSLLNASLRESNREKNSSKTGVTSIENAYKSSPESTNPDDETADLMSTSSDFSVKSWLLSSLAKAAVGSLLPEHLSIPEVNSTKGFWHMAVNLALGNPREESGRKGAFWTMLREYGGMEGSSDTEPTPYWITKCLQNPDRPQYEIPLKKLHRIITQPQPICQHVEMVGGIFNWKKGRMEDERALCLDNDVTPQKTDCLVYSFGLKSEWVFEEALEKKGCKVYVFDPTGSSGNHNHTRGIHFYSVGVSDINTTRKVNGEVLRLFTLASILNHFGHETTPISYMRLGIGGEEWKVLQQVMDNTPESLSNVKQLNLEVNLHHALEDPSFYEKYLDILENLESLGFQLFFSKTIQSRENNLFFDPLVGEEVCLSNQMLFLRI